MAAEAHRGDVQARLPQLSHICPFQLLSDKKSLCTVWGRMRRVRRKAVCRLANHDVSIFVVIVTIAHCDLEWHAIRAIVRHHNSDVSLFQHARWLCETETNVVSHLGRACARTARGQHWCGVRVLARLEAAIGESLVRRRQRLICTLRGAFGAIAHQKSSNLALRSVEWSTPSLRSQIHISTAAAKSAHAGQMTVMSRQYQWHETLLVALVWIYSGADQESHRLGSVSTGCVMKHGGPILCAHLRICPSR
mmetsp:Transcript_28463/g.65991  ORF Transcript_28463/g.65991 Transcript_28463/m.65991 type:complete len:250 (+) Transcript_28463:1462-2211(+)